MPSILSSELPERVITPFIMALKVVFGIKLPSFGHGTQNGVAQGLGPMSPALGLARSLGFKGNVIQYPEPSSVEWGGTTKDQGHFAPLSWLMLVNDFFSTKKLNHLGWKKSKIDTLLYLIQVKVTEKKPISQKGSSQPHSNVPNALSHVSSVVVRSCSFSFFPPRVSVSF